MFAKLKSKASGPCAIRSPTKKLADVPAMPGVRRLLRRLTALLSLLLLISPALAEEPVRIGSGFGLAFLPGYICEDLKLVEKYGKTAHLALQPSYQRFLGAAPL